MNQYHYHYHPHGGQLRSIAKQYNISEEMLLDFSVNINPLGFPDWFRSHLIANIGKVARYPDPEYKELKSAIAKHHQVSEDAIILSNGASEFFFTLTRALSRKVAIIPRPSFFIYEQSARLQKMELVSLYPPKEQNFKLDATQLSDTLLKYPQEECLVFLCHPNNPTANVLNPEEIISVAKNFPHALFVVDEAFIYFTPWEVKSFLELLPLLNSVNNIIVSRSLTKVLSIPGMRIAYAVATPAIAITMNAYLPTWNLNQLAAETATYALSNDLDYFKRTRQEMSELRKDFAHLPYCYANEANFLLLHFPNRSSDDIVKEFITSHKIVLRNCKSFDGLSDGHVRIAIKSREENEKLLAHLPLSTSKSKTIHTRSSSRSHTPALMVLGTSSDAGKSLIVTALCRIFKQDGIKVAPFKAQNMSLNSFVTPLGEEIGRAQAVQAEAAQIAMDARMNPILLKPSSKEKSQVILHGKPLGHFHFSDYTKQKQELFSEVAKAYDSLASEYELIILEGAGSVSEVNLKANDIVNMRMAKYAKAKVLLVGDIDRGGLFGSFIGSVNTLYEWERKLLKGLIINNFRGVTALLTPGIAYLQSMTETPLIGIIPHLPQLRIPLEDSLALKNNRLLATNVISNSNTIDIIFIRTPYLSNFTDIDPLLIEPDVQLRIVDNAEDFGTPRLIILGGSKSVLNDLHFLKTSGLQKKIEDQLKAFPQTMIAGICGGLQMLGAEVFDPLHLESPIEKAEGLSLLPLRTTIMHEKILKRTSATLTRSKHQVVGHEIHHGETIPCGDSAYPFIESGDRIIGYCNQDATVWGTYLHGIFENDLFRHHLLSELQGRPRQSSAKYSMEEEYDRLADAVRASLDFNYIYSLLNLKR
ncbi:MAG: cobyric acid synthase [Oligoflexia bacterium]|nr:cobyric acid synthase [Oligoflexia bacterium]